MTPRPVDAIFPGRLEALRSGTCRRCKEAVDPDGFTDDLSRVEWELSALCEPCQTVVFSAMEDECE